MATISILGSGWLGLPLARQLYDRGFEVHLSTTSPERRAELAAVNAIPFIVDISRPDEIPEKFLDCDVLVINITSKDVDAFARFRKIIDQAGIDRVLFVSSTSVYPDCNCEISENMGLEDHGHPLFRIESLLTESEKFALSVVRFGGLIGYSRNPGRFFAAGRAVPNPDGYVNLIHRDDCIAIIQRIIERKVWGRVFNACADKHPKRFDFYHYCAQRSGLAVPVPGHGDTYKIINNQYLKKVLEYHFAHPDPMQMQFET